MRTLLRGTAVVLTSAVLLLSVSACTSVPAPDSIPDQSTSWDRASSKRAFDRIYSIITTSVGKASWSARSTWLDCSDDESDSEQTQYDITATRRVPLIGGPEQAMEKVEDALRKAGFDVRIQHDRAAGSTAIGYPNGFNGGTAADGNGWEVVARESGIAFGGTGPCVPGPVPGRDSPLNNTPLP